MGFTRHDTAVGCHALQGSSQPRNLIQVSYISTLASKSSFITSATWGGPFFLTEYANIGLPGSPLVGISHTSNAGGADLIPVWGTKIPHASQPEKQNKRICQYHHNITVLVAQSWSDSCNPMDYCSPQAPLSVRFSGKTLKGCHAHLHRIFPTQDRTCISYVSSTARRVLYLISTTWETHLFGRATT